MDEKSDNDTVVTIMIFIAGLVIAVLGVYLMTIWEYQILYTGNNIYNIPLQSVQKIYPYLTYGIITIIVGIILVADAIVRVYCD